MLLAFELDDGCDCCSAVVFLEEGCLKGLAWHPFKIPGLHYALGAQDLAEFAVEAVFGAVRVDMGEVPLAAGADIHLLDCQLVFSEAHPVDKELGVGVCSEHRLPWSVKRAFYSDFRIVRCRDYGRFRGR